MLHSNNQNIDLQISMNKRTHFFMKIYISHTLFSMFLWSVRDEWRQGQTSILTQLLLFDHSSTSSASWQGLLNRSSLRTTALSLQADPHSSLPVSTLSTATATYLYSFITSTCFRVFFCLFILVHLFIDGSVKGQYITIIFVNT